MDNEIQVISGTESLGAVIGAEIDRQIATAHAYPRDVERCISKITKIATMKDVAPKCFYRLERKDSKTRETSVIEGPSIRLAEIVASNWGNLRVASRVIGNDGKMVTVEAVCHDLESNVAVSQQQVRSIRTSNGMTYSNDMQILTINAASSIAVRNAINKVIPLAITNHIVEACKNAVLESENVEKLLPGWIDWYAKIGVTKEMLYAKFGISNDSEVTSDHLINFSGLCNAINEGITTKEEQFPTQQADTNPELAKRAQEAVKKIKEGK